MDIKIILATTTVFILVAIALRNIFKIDSRSFPRNILSMLVIYFVAFGISRTLFWESNKGSDSTQGTELVTPGQSVKIPSKDELLKPLQKEIVFYETRKEIPEKLTDVENEYCNFTFSNYGATIASLNFKKREGKNNVDIQTIALQEDQKNETPFLLVFEKGAPYTYQFHDYKKTDTEQKIVYTTQFEGWKIYKTFTIPNKGYTLTLTCSFEPLAKAARPLNSRLIVSGPYSVEIASDAQEGFVFNSKQKSLEKYYEGQDSEKAWILPSVVGVEDRYFTHALINDVNGFVQRAYFAKSRPNHVLAIVEGAKVAKASSFSLQFYVGPKDIHDLVSADARLEGLLSFGWFSWLCRLLILLLEWLYLYLGNFGVAIIVMSILIRIPMIPLSIRGAEVMEKMQRLRPKLKKIEEKYKHDIQQLQIETMKFYREHGMSSLGPVVGCLPQLIDIPIMIALYRVLGNYIDLYKAPFIGWIHDLSAADPYFVLPILMGVVTLWQQRLTPAIDERQRILGFFMPIMLIGIFAYASAGLVLYWTVKSALMIGETYLRKSKR